LTPILSLNLQKQGRTLSTLKFRPLYQCCQLLVKVFCQINQKIWSLAKKLGPTQHTYQKLMLLTLFKDSDVDKITIFCGNLNILCEKQHSKNFRFFRAFFVNLSYLRPHVLSSAQNFKQLLLSSAAEISAPW
jgi:hypothetical protein